MLVSGVVVYIHVNDKAIVEASVMWVGEENRPVGWGEGREESCGGAWRG
jgi:hypothetical protein